MRLDVTESRRRFAAARVARLATVDAAGRPHLVPVTFACDGDRVVTAVDHKPKTTTALRRLANIEANPAVSFLADHYDENWTELWWVRADATAEVVTDGPDHTGAVDLLGRKYPQYRGLRPTGPVIVAEVRRWSGWQAGARRGS